MPRSNVCSSNSALEPICRLNSSLLPIVGLQQEQQAPDGVFIDALEPARLPDSFAPVHKGDMFAIEADAYSIRKVASWCVKAREVVFDQLPDRFGASALLTQFAGRLVFDDDMTVYDVTLSPPQALLRAGWRKP